MGLQLVDISKSFAGKTAVSGISLDIPEGKVFGLLGLNGAGKSTTIRMVLDILQPDSGEILWQGAPAKQSLRKNVGYLPEERGLYPHMKVFPQLVMFGRLQGMTKHDAVVAAKQWLERFEISHYQNSLVSELSKGNQQKIQFIAAIIHTPELIILDEPFSGLDPVNTELFKSVFRELADAKRTVVFSSHRLDHVEELSDAIAIIHESKVALTGQVEDILVAQKPEWVRIGAPIDEITRRLPGAQWKAEKGLVTIALNGSFAPKELLSSLVNSGVLVTHYELVRPSLTTIFLRKVGQSA